MKDLFTNGLNYFLITSAVTLVTTLLINSICHRLINNFAKKHKDKVTTSHYLFQTVRATVWIVGLTIIFRQIKPLSTIGNTILGATSIIAVAVGIAAQATFGNYIAGFFLAIHQPFKVGDIIFIKERGLSGTVKEITFRHTVLLTQEQTEIIIPNTVMNNVAIEDMSNGHYSELIELHVKGEADLKKLQTVIDGLLKEEKLIHHERGTDLVVRGIDRNGFTVAFPVHTDSLQDVGKVRNSLLPKLYQELKKEKIELY